MAHILQDHSSHQPQQSGRAHRSGQVRRWKDWANVVFGLLLALSPWILQFTGLEAATLNAVLIGGLIFALSALALTLLDRWESYVSGLLGIWAMLSPWLIGFTVYDMAMLAHLGLGALVVTVAALDIWQRGAADAA